MATSTRAVVKLPKLATDADYAFDFAFYEGDLFTPHDFADDDVFVLTLTSTTTAKITWRSDGGSPVLELIGHNVVGVRLPESVAQSYQNATYSYELRRIGADASIDLLVVGTCWIQAGLSLSGTAHSPKDAIYGFSDEISTTVQIVYQAARVQVVYPNSAPVSLVRSAALIEFDDTQADIGVDNVQDAIDALAQRSSVSVPKYRSHPNVTASQTIDPAYQYWPIDASSNDVVLTLPAGIDASECAFDIQRIDNSSHTVTVEAAVDEDIDIARVGTVTNFTLDGQFDSATVKNILGGLKWRVI